MKYYLNISGGGIDDSLVGCYSNKKDLRRNWKKDAIDFICGRGVEGDGDWYPYFQVERANGDIDEIPIRELFGRTA
jgi:hypothetical protein